MKHTSDFVQEAARQVPIAFQADVVVCGGGTAGLAAAVCAARDGLSTVMIERVAEPGGMVTQVTQWLSDFATKGGFPREFLTRIRAEGIEETPYYNPWRIVPYFDELLSDAGVRVLYLSNAVAPILSDEGLGGVFVESKSGRCIGGEHEAQASYRVIANCMAMGEAAAIAAHLALQHGCRVRDIPVAELVVEMKRRGYAHG